jgi:hypothetical protein
LPATPSLVGALKTPAQKGRDKKEDVKTFAAEKPSTRGSGKTKAIVDTTAKSIPAGLTGKQERLAQAPVVTIPAKEELKAITECLVLAQDQEEPKPSKAQEAKAKAAKEQEDRHGAPRDQNCKRA